MNVYRRLLIPVGATLLLLASLSAAAASSSAVDSALPSLTEGAIVAEGPDMVVREAGDWVTFEYKDSLPEAEVRIHRGERVDGACTYSLSRTVDPSEDGISEEREIAHDASSCVMVTEVGSRPRSEVDLDESERRGATATESATPVVDGEIADDGPVTLSSRSAWHRTRYRDPALLTVTRATTNVSWNYNGSCVTNSWGHTTNYYWLAASGWSKTSSNTSASQNCSRARTTSNSYFRNSAFCVGQPTTYTSFAPNRIDGNANGSYTAAATPSKSGGCSSWLSYQSHAGLQ